MGAASPASAVVSTPLLPSLDWVVPQGVLHHSEKKHSLAIGGIFHFGVVLPSRNPQGLAKLAHEVSSPTSSHYHQFLTPNQVVSRFGPDSTLVASLSQKLRQSGFAVTLRNQILSVTGSVGQVNQLFRTQLTEYQNGSVTFIAPSTALAVPSWLRSASGLTGLTQQKIPNTGYINTRPVMTHWATPSTMGASPAGSEATATNGPFTVTVKRLTKGSRAPGLAVRYLVTATLNGAVDTAPLQVVSLSGPFEGAASFVQYYSNPGAGQIVVDFSMSQAQSISQSLTVTDGTNSATVQLPVAHFVGPNAATTNAATLFGGVGLTGSILAPWNPVTNNVNTVFNAGRVVASRHAQRRIGVYTAGGISQNGAYTGIRFTVPETDARLFAHQFGLKPAHYKVGYVGPNSVADSQYGGIEGEMSLDLQMMETSAPGAHVVVYSAGSLRSALNQVDQQDKVSVFSISYGAGELAEQAYNANAQASWDLLAQIANLEGITISVSAGDSGAFSGAQFGLNTPQPNYPANSPYVSAIGGTEDAVTPQGTLTQAALWGGNLGQDIPQATLLQFLSLQNMMASGGVSTLERAPGYQAALNPTLSGRLTPDISLPASVVTPGYYAYFDGGPNLSGGTSAGAPLFAGWMADLAASSGRLGNVNPILYYLSQVPSGQLPGGAVVTPVAFGNNGVYSVTPGDNAASGLGQLNVGGLMMALQQRH